MLGITIKLVAIILLLLGSLLGFIGVLSYISDLDVYSLSKSKKIDTIFLYTSEKINKHYSVYERNPTQEEFESWRGELSNIGFYGELITYSTSDYPKELIELFGYPSQPSYALIIWRGEWYEYYVSWVNKSSLPKKLSEYYFTGYKVGDFIVVIIFSCFLLVISFYTFRKAPKKHFK